ncbi:PilN domain-containing protein [Thermosulfurimonas dismutans]|uniref:PilN domain-containing protein n=1 Tax=Thermosulfurimonas dismutans TaxID=999894 RepID=UPI0008384E03|nr:PilN domain-containing protein [Thermosulfurimonas dismutans]
MIIKLNFIPREERKRFVFRVSWLNLYISVLLILLVTILFSFIWINRELALLEREKSFLQQERNRYRKVIRKIGQLKKENQEIKNRIEAIINLKKKKGHNIKVLDDVLLAVPLGKIYLTRLELSNSMVTIVGFAVDYENVAIFLKKLESTGDLFKEVNLQYTKQKNVKGYNLVEFRIWIKY